MIWFIFHNIIKQIPSIDTQTKNLWVFLIGVTAYTFLYSWLGSVSKNNGSFLHFFFNFFSYIILADGFAMAIIYKNYFSRSIFSEVKETFGVPKEENTLKNTTTNLVNEFLFPKPHANCHNINKDDLFDDNLEEDDVEDEEDEEDEEEAEQ